MFKGKMMSGKPFQVNGSRVSSDKPYVQKLLRFLAGRMPPDYYPTKKDEENAIGQFLVSLTDGAVVQMSDAPDDDFDTHGPPDENGLCECIKH